MTVLHQNFELKHRIAPEAGQLSVRPQVGQRFRQCENPTCTDTVSYLKFIPSTRLPVSINPLNKCVFLAVFVNLLWAASTGVARQSGQERAMVTAIAQSLLFLLLLQTILGARGGPVPAPGGNRKYSL